MLNVIEDVLESPSTQPNHGTYIPELKALGITSYRQIFYKSYRIVYRVIETNVIIYLIVDGRRNMQTYLSQRFFK